MLKVLKLQALPPLVRGGIIFIFSFILSLAIFSVASAIMGLSVPVALKTLLFTSFSTKFGFLETAQKAFALVLTTYAFSIPFRIRLYNIGGAGQMVFGAIAATIIGLGFSGTGSTLPMIVLVPLMLLSAFIAGGLYASIAAWFKVGFNIDPVISTILLNFVALLLMDFVCTTNPWRDPIAGEPTTLAIPATAVLPRYASLIIVVGVVFVIYTFINRSRTGYEIQSLGNNKKAAQTFGINYSRLAILTFLIAGGIAGLGGALEVMVIHHKLIAGFQLTSGAEFGTFGILACLLVSGKEMGVPFAAFFVSILLVGADALQRTLMVPSEIAFIIQALIVIILVVIRAEAERV